MTLLSNKGRDLVVPASIIFLASIFSILMQGYTYGSQNNIFHIPIVLDYLASDEGPHDVFVESLERFPSFFWIVLKNILHEGNIEAGFLTLHLLTRICFGFIVFFCLQSLARNRLMNAAITGCIIGFPGFLATSFLGRNELLMSYLSHSQVAFMTIMASWLALRYRRYFLCAAILGFSFNINAFLSFWSALAVGGSVLWIMRDQALMQIIKIGGLMTAIFTPAFPM